MLVGWFRPSTTFLTASVGSTTVGSTACASPLFMMEHIATTRAATSAGNWIVIFIDLSSGARSPNGPGGLYACEGNRERLSWDPSHGHVGLPFYSTPGRFSERENLRCR